MLKNFHQSWVLGFALAALTSLPALADTPITQFTPGFLVVLRGGDASNPDTATSTNEVAVYLDEYTPSGTYVGTHECRFLGGCQHL